MTPIRQKRRISGGSGGGPLLALSTCAGGDMTRTAVLGSVLVLGFAVSAAAQDRGAQLFADQKCAVCHSIAGKGNAKGPLDNVGGTLKPEEIREWLTDAKAMTAKTKAPRKPEMRQYSMPKEDVDALVAYLSTLKKK